MIRAALPTLACLLVFLAGCSFTPPPKPKYFLLNPGKPPSMKSIRPSDAPATASVSFVDVAAPFAADGFVYQTKPGNWETDPYNQFLVSPADMMTSIIRNWTRESGLYGDVAVPGAGGGQDFLIDCDLTEIYGDFSVPTSPKAVLTIEAQVFHRTEKGRDVVLRRTFTQSIPIAARTPEALIAAWNEALRTELSLLLRALGENAR
ncbi:MAG TPA: ABC-type transport auxiliary lipoprotein family protein [Chthoniobacterales bacterium]|jgi:uncharacterized lipoprotein YmbA|nr:ABC-type transport auxiliary lipoprotein family protein [Chthoniobacterales bacterium]